MVQGSTYGSPATTAGSTPPTTTTPAAVGRAGTRSEGPSPVACCPAPQSLPWLGIPAESSWTCGSPATMAGSIPPTTTTPAADGRRGDQSDHHSLKPSLRQSFDQYGLASPTLPLQTRPIQL